MIQLFAKISDLIPYETKALCEGLPFFSEWKEDILKNGCKYALQVTHEGVIVDGNARYWILKDMGVKYVPIDLQYFVGLQYEFSPEVLHIRGSILNEITRGFGQKKNVIFEFKKTENFTEVGE